MRPISSPSFGSRMVQPAGYVAPVVGLVPGDRRADSSKVARLAGARRAGIAKAAEVVEATGFEPGGVAPFPLERVTVVLVERTLAGGAPDNVSVVAVKGALRGGGKP